MTLTLSLEKFVLENYSVRQLPKGFSGGAAKVRFVQANIPEWGALGKLDTGFWNSP